MALTKSQIENRINWCETFRLAYFGSALCRHLSKDDEGRGCLVGIMIPVHEEYPLGLKTYDAVGYSYTELCKLVGISHEEIIQKMIVWDNGAKYKSIQKWLEKKAMEV
jgi:hypothetical protein